MSDLISRNELIMHLSDYALNESPNDNESTSEQRISRMVYNAIQNCISCVENQPTAYDVDKVVEELETNKQNALEVEESIKEYNVWNKAIEIVKQGGDVKKVVE